MTRRRPRLLVNMKKTARSVLIYGKSSLEPFDNVMITDDPEAAKKAGEDLWAVTKDAEKKMKDEQDEEERKKAEAEAKTDEDEDDEDLDDIEEDEEEEKEDEGHDEL